MRSVVLGALLCVACSPAATVELKTRVGQPTEEDPHAQFQSASKVVTALWDARRPMIRQLDPSDAVVTPPRAPDEFHSLVQRIEHGSLEEIAAPARNLAEADASNWILVKAGLLAKRPHSKGEYRSLLAVIGGDVPNRYGHFALHWKKAHGHRVKVSEDWFEDLLIMPMSKVGNPMYPVYRDTVLATALFRAASKIGRENPALAEDVVGSLLDAAYMHRGTFRDEVGRAISEMGDEAVPHLLRASIPPSYRKRDQDTIPVKRAAYAVYSLDRMDRLHPQRAFTSVRDDPRRLVSLLAAYRDLKMGEAAPFILEYVDSPTPKVRDGAKEAFFAYVTGPTPTIRKKTLRLLGGGTTRRSAHVSYRGLAKQAIRERLGDERPELLEEACDLFDEDGEIDTKCEGQPERQTRAYFGWLKARRRAKQEGIIMSSLADDDREAAIDRLDRLLASGAELDRPQRLVPFFEEAAKEAVAAGHPSRAAQLLRKSAMLLASTDAKAADQLTARALIHEASLEDLDAQGRNMLLGTARSLAEGDDDLLGALSDARSEQSFEDPGEVRAQLLKGVGLLAVILACLGLAGSLIRRRLYVGRA